MSLVALNRIGWRLADSIAWHRVYVGLEEPYRGSLILHVSMVTPHSLGRPLWAGVPIADAQPRRSDGNLRAIRALSLNSKRG